MHLLQAPKIKELPIYGSNRLGQHNGKGAIHQLASYKRIYEYANHLGNVLATTHDNGISFHFRITSHLV
ncbi:hypothetical protein [Flammeovirga aprica]|uniref:Uncharacterized protein n=1 Tax=Flammeovirga aprica JL-4 TaxID=694437 RepID=A0A7X9P365_9BACT|nr:hypothetical protein [Flammeovirga aprica]NME68495.1 hypothetical protein [Flammeovirga aprica JL-4]